jgi:hypothetical protein
MATTKIACPRCRAVLKSNQAPPIGKSIKCPGCGSAFPVTADMVQAVPTAPLAAAPLPVAQAVPVPARQAMPVAVPAAPPQPGTLSMARLGYVAAGFFVWLALGTILGYYCFSVNRSAAEGKDGQGDKEARKQREKEKEHEQLITPPKEQQAKINEAVNRAVRYLKSKQLDSGTWPTTIGWPVGHAALPGLTLLECGVPANDPNVQKAANFVRDNSPRTEQTYELALSVLFLDRLGNYADKELIRKLALRLIAGQGQSGGWSYVCPNLSTEEQTQLDQLLREANPAQAREKAANLEGVFPKIGVFKSFSENAPCFNGRVADNSNTQFAALALWVARRHDIPLERTADLLEQRFRKTQFHPPPGNEALDGSWGYDGPGRQVIGVKMPTMTAAGLLCLAIARGVKSDAKAENDAIDKAFKVIGRTIDVEEDASSKPSVNDLYYLWSVERVSVLYQKKTIPAPNGRSRDWYKWGSGMLLPNQKEDGSWNTNSYPGSNPVIDTCFATLFLRQANLAKDLTSKLQRLSGQ